MSSENAAPVIEVVDLVKEYRIYKREVHRMTDLLGIGRGNRFQPFRALDGVSLSIGRGECIGIIGKNGSGKSTLLQLICGTLTPSSGRVALHGRVAALLELGAGFDPEFTGRENVYLSAAIYGLSRDEVEARFDDIVSFSGIKDFIDRPVKTYSSGMYVRLAFSIIAHIDADVLVIDEALAVGDASFNSRCMLFLRKFRKTGTIVFVSHDTSAVLGLCDRVIWIDGGKTRLLGPAKQVCEAYLAYLHGVEPKSATQPKTEVAPPERPEDGTPPVPVSAPREAWRDARRDWVNGSNLRNDLEVFAFDQTQGDAFGSGGARISNVRFVDPEGAPFAWIVGGEEATLAVDVEVLGTLAQPIVGFYVKDRLGQNLFGDNTYLFASGAVPSGPVPATAGEVLTARFTFPMPVLPPGKYVIAVAVADGTQEEHVQHHWVHDAVVFQSHASHNTGGLVGIPMYAVSLAKAPADPEDGTNEVDVTDDRP